MIIAIDGPAGSGKSSVAKSVAEKHGFYLLNSGYFYRSVTFLAIKQNILSDTDKIVELAKTLSFNIAENSFMVSGENLIAFLHSDEVSSSVANVSSIAELRGILNQKMRDIFASKNVVCEGRDMTTVLFPNADIKIYLDASVKIRAKRRYDQQVSDLLLDEIEKNIQYRDDIDKNKEVGALVQTDDAIYIDSSDLTLLDIVNKIDTLIALKS